MKTLAAFLCLVTTAFCGDLPTNMKRIEGGTFIPLYGEKNKPHTVKTFLLDTHPVTNARFLAFVKANPQWQRSQAKQIFAGPGYLAHWKSDTELGPLAAPDAPVTMISWFAARAFLKAEGKRLPTEDEWEFTARADKSKLDATQDPEFIKQLLAWYSRPGNLPPPLVQNMESNLHGIYGLHGATWEWVLDFNSQMVTGESRSDKSLDRSLFCGSSSLNATDMANYAAFMRFAFRSSLEGSYCVGTLGFRGAMDAPQPSSQQPISKP